MKSVVAVMQGNVAKDVAAWAANVSTSVLIVFVNKVLMDSKGYGFHYGGSICCAGKLNATLLHSKSC